MQIYQDRYVQSQIVKMKNNVKLKYLEYQGFVKVSLKSQQMFMYCNFDILSSHTCNHCPIVFEIPGFDCN